MEGETESRGGRGTIEPLFGQRRSMIKTWRTDCSSKIKRQIKPYFFIAHWPQAASHLRTEEDRKSRVTEILLCGWNNGCYKCDQSTSIIVKICTKICEGYHKMGEKLALNIFAFQSRKAFTF